MKIGEKILFALSRDPLGDDYANGINKEMNLDNSLLLLSRVFPNFMNSIYGKKILDFGCGLGWQSIGLAKNGAKVLGLDTNAKSLEKARNLSKKLGIEDNVVFMEKLEDRHIGQFDIVISQNSMEHFENPSRTLYEMISAINCNGKIFITFGPPWFSPFGSHMHVFTKVPWVNIIFSEETVMAVRSYYRNDGALRYEEVESGLNRMSVAKFEKIIVTSGLKTEYKKYDCIKNLNFLGKLPLIRELFINRISCILKKPNEK